MVTSRRMISRLVAGTGFVVTLALVAHGYAVATEPDNSSSEVDPSSVGTSADIVLTEAHKEGTAGSGINEGSTPSMAALSTVDRGECGMPGALLDSAIATHQSLASRVDGHGLAPTSLTGTYPAGIMYVRDAAAQAISMMKMGLTTLRF